MTKLILEDQNFFKNKVKELVKEALKQTYQNIDLGNEGEQHHRNEENIKKQEMNKNEDTHNKNHILKPIILIKLSEPKLTFCSFGFVRDTFFYKLI